MNSRAKTMQPNEARTTDQRLLAEVERLGDTIGRLANRVAGGQPERIFQAISQLANKVALDGPPPPKADSLPPIDEQKKAILGSPGAKKFGFTEEVLGGMAPDAVAEVYSGLPKTNYIHVSLDKIKGLSPP